jgi:hypothetical protein
MSSFARPGVYIQENIVQQNITTQSRTDAVAAFIGQLPKGPIVPTLVATWADFVKYFGGVNSTYPTTAALFTFFSNGGRNAYIQRVVPSDATVASYTYTVTGGSFVINAINKGSWGTSLYVETISGSIPGRFSLAVYGSPLVSGGDLRSNVLEQWTDLSLTSTDARYAIDIINAFSAYINVSVTGTPTAPPATTNIVQTLSGGTDGTALVGSTLYQITDTLPNFDNITSPLIFNAPDISKVASGATYSSNRGYSIATWAKLLKYAEYRGDGFVVVDTPNETSAGNTMSAFDAQVYAGDVYSQTTSAGVSTTSQSITTLTTDSTSVTYTTGTSPHGFLVGQTVTVSGLSNTVALNSTAATAVKPGYQGPTAVAGYVTFQTAQDHGFKTGDSVIITGVTPTTYNNGGTAYTITRLDNNKFYVASSVTTTPSAVTNATASSAGLNGSFTITAVPATTKFTVSNTEAIANPVVIPTASSSYLANVTTINTTGNHNLTAGQTVVIQGVVPDAYNGTWVTAASTATNVLKITTNADLGAITTAGTVSGGLGLTTASAATATGFATATGSVTNSWSAVSSLASNGAIYYPWLKIPDTTKSVPGVTTPVAPGGAVIGQYQATDASRGVFKTPAGYGTRIGTAVDVTKRLTNAELDSLNTGSGNTTATPVNAIRNVPGAGIVIMGGRTLANTSPNRYINIRRSIINVKKQVERISQFALFENNDEYLWAQLRNTVGGFLNQYWQQGGLRGTSPEEAYYVKVDGTTTTNTDIANGQVNIQIGIALEYPAEFVVINIGQLTGSSTAI